MFRCLTPGQGRALAERWADVYRRRVGVLPMLSGRSQTTRGNTPQYVQFLDGRLANGKECEPQCRANAVPMLGRCSDAGPPVSNDWDNVSVTMLPCKTQRQYLFTTKLSSYCFWASSRHYGRSHNIACCFNMNPRRVQAEAAKQ